MVGVTRAAPVRDVAMVADLCAGTEAVHEGLSTEFSLVLLRHQQTSRRWGCDGYTTTMNRCFLHFGALLELKIALRSVNIFCACGLHVVVVCMVVCQLVVVTFWPLCGMPKPKSQDKRLITS